jgi:hypothetical protein
MPKAVWYLGAPLVAVAGIVSGRPSGILLTLIVVVVYLASIRFHPRARHTGFRGCGGSGEHQYGLFPWTHRRDPACQGGRTIRHGARVLGSPAIRQEARDFKETRRRRKEARAWR